MRLAIWPERRLVIQRISGVVAVREIIAAIQLLWNDARFRGDFNGIIDLRRCTTTAGQADFRILVEFLKQDCPARGHWVALLDDPKSTALALLFKALNPGPFSFDVCSTWETACRHLRIELPPGYETK